MAADHAQPGERTVTRGDLLRSFWLWTFFSHSNYNYERLQGTGFAHAMTPIIRRLYETPDEIRAALRRHLIFFNVEPNLGGVVHGTVIAMEEQRANGASEIDDDAINAVKTGLMGPIAGVGDTINQGTITPILLSIGIGLAASGNVLGPILYFVLEMAAVLSIGYFAYMQGYYRGRSGVLQLLRSGVLDRVILGAGVLGNFVLGALAAQFVVVNLAPAFTVGGTRLDLQRDVLDRLLPGVVPLFVVLLTWYLLARRRVSPIVLLVAYVAIAIVGAVPFFGAPGDCAASVLTPFGPCPAPQSGGG
ncbi:MAG: PTS system mannose/fructose/sorbose family transporter subunit IID [Candidatus Limnocylindria bacterium]